MTAEIIKMTWEFQIEKAVGVRLLNQRSVPSSEVSKILEENGFKIKTSFRTTITQEGNSSTLRIFKSRDQLRPNIGHLTITVEPTERMANGKVIISEPIYWTWPSLNPELEARLERATDLAETMQLKNTHLTCELDSALQFNIDEFISKLLAAQRIDGYKAKLECQEIKTLCAKAKVVLLNQPMLLDIEAPVNICGDIHGQYEDILRIFTRCGYPDTASYLFLGDYVDRGKNSIEVICLLLALKVKHPSKIHLLRGNHESIIMNEHFGFVKECESRELDVYQSFTDVFDVMPIAAIVSGKFFCCHGGLSPDMNIDAIRKIQRPCPVPSRGIMFETLWNDPAKPEVSGWAGNTRGSCRTFGEDVVSEFLQRNGLELIVRAHQMMREGFAFNTKKQLVTVFSAPNYCGKLNKGAVMSVTRELSIEFIIFNPLSDDEECVESPSKKMCI